MVTQSRMRPQRILPGIGQESVWDYPRPPRLETCGKRIEVIFNGVTIADSRRVMRVLETSHPPVYYIPPEDIRMEYLFQSRGHSFCEWKGHARYYGIVVDGKRADRVAWSYPTPTPAFAGIRHHLAFYAGPMDACLVDGVRAIPQSGAFYGGWITPDVVGPFKGEEGSDHW